MNTFNSSVPAVPGDSGPLVFPVTGQPIRTVVVDGEPWFVAADVCAVLGIGNNRDAVARVDDGDKGVGTVDTLGGPQQMVTVNESGLYDLILDSRKPEARAFRKWVTSEVLPSIRKTGQYAVPKSELELARDYVRALEAKEELRAQIAELEPKAEKWSRFMDADGLIGMTALADMLGVRVGDMTNWLVDSHIFRKQTSHGELHFERPRNMPRLSYQRSGLFTVKIEESNFVKYPVVYATSRGADLISDLWSARKN